MTTVRGSGILKQSTRPPNRDLRDFSIVNSPRVKPLPYPSVNQLPDLQKLFTAHHSLLITHYSSFSLFPFPVSSLTIHHSPFTIHHSPKNPAPILAKNKR